MAAFYSKSSKKKNVNRNTCAIYMPGDWALMLHWITSLSVVILNCTRLHRQLSEAVHASFWTKGHARCNTQNIAHIPAMHILTSCKVQRKTSMHRPLQQPMLEPQIIQKRLVKDRWMVPRNRCSQYDRRSRSNNTHLENGPFRWAGSDPEVVNVPTN